MGGDIMEINKLIAELRQIPQCFVVATEDRYIAIGELAHAAARAIEEMEETEHEAWAEVEQEINDLIIDILRHELTYCVGIYDFSIESIIHY